VAQFVVFEKVNDIVASKVDKTTLFPGSETVINFSCGLVAGGVAALVSQPADTMLSKINQTEAKPGETTTGRLIKIARELGVRGSFAGSGPRLFMVCILFRCLGRSRANSRPRIGWDNGCRPICDIRFVSLSKCLGDSRADIA
jgi:hypothetical protein